jgi:periplasmic divalent cation tolerance protein
VDQLPPKLSKLIALPPLCMLSPVNLLYRYTMQAIIAFSTCPNQESAAAIARELVEQRLAACVSVMPSMLSTYRWNGEVTTDNEVLLMIKTTRSGFEALRARLLTLHPYELPEIVAVDIVAAHAPYLAWLDQQVGTREHTA